MISCFLRSGAEISNQWRTLIPCCVSLHVEEHASVQALIHLCHPPVGDGGSHTWLVSLDGETVLTSPFFLLSWEGAASASSALRCLALRCLRGSRPPREGLRGPELTVTYCKGLSRPGVRLANWLPGMSDSPVPAWAIMQIFLFPRGLILGDSICQLA